MTRSKRTIATDISAKTRQEVIERDKGCIFCRSGYGIQIAHYIPRSGGGLGIKENLACACWICHHQLDQTTKRKAMLEYFKRYLDSRYPDFKDEDRIFRKYKI